MATPNGLIGMFLQFRRKPGCRYDHGTIIGVDRDMVLVVPTYSDHEPTALDRYVVAIPRSEVYSDDCRLFVELEQMHLSLQAKGMAELSKSGFD